MPRVLTLSTTFPGYHINSGKPTFFVEKLISALDEIGLTETFSVTDNNVPFDMTFYLDCESKYHTIRKGKRWKVGDWFSPRIWGTDINPKSARTGPYHSKQIIIAPNVQIKQVYDFKINNHGSIFIDNKHFGYYGEICKNDGLTPADFRSWFKIKTGDSGTTPLFDGQIICWVDKDIVNYNE